MGSITAQQEYRVTRLGGSDPGHHAPVSNQPDTGDGWRRKDRFSIGFVVERHVAGDDRKSKRGTASPMP